MSGFQGVFWDFGGVITSSPFERFNQLEQRLGLPQDFIRRVNATNPHDNAWARLERKELGLEAFDRLFRRESAALGHELSGTEVLGALAGRLRPAMVQALKKIRARGLVQGCLTNNVVSLEDGGDRDLPPEVAEVLRIFDFIQESGAENRRKPEPEFYRLAMEKSGLQDPSLAIFLDDLGINLKPARAMGMHTIKVAEPARALSELEDLLGFQIS